MTTLKNLKGTAIQFRDEDPAVYAGSWSSGGTMNTATLRGGGVGTQTAALSIAGVVNPDTVSGKTESYNGTAWTELGDLNTTRYIGNFVFGTQTAAIGAGGATGGPGTPTVAVVEQWNGSAWTEVGDLNKAKVQGGGSGTTSGGLIFGGFTFPGGPPTFVILAETETWNGSAWTEVNDLNAVRYTNTGSKGGSSTASITFGRATSPTAIVEKWDGTNWTEVGDLNSGRESIGGSGTSTDGLGFGGTPNTTKTEAYNGTSWTEVADLSVGRSQIGGTGASGSSALAFGGATPSESSATEEWSFPSGSIVQEGDMWFNSNTSTLKGYAVSLPTGTWASGGDLNTARSRFGGAGQATQSAALVFGAGAPPYGQTEEYNGTAWSEQNDMNTGRYISPGGAGTQTAALTAGGYNPAGSPVYNTVNSESYNGTSWTEGNNLNEGRIDCVTFGSSTAAILVGGGEASGGPGTVSSVEIYDGTSWTETTNIPTATQEMAGWGIQTSGAIVGGSVDSDPTMKNTTVEWDGTSWSSGGNYSRNNKYFQAFGSSVTAGLAAGGENPGESPARLSIAAAYNGTSWSEVAELSSARYGTAGGGTTASGLISGGETAPTTVASTEEWTAPAAVVTVTTS